MGLYSPSIQLKWRLQKTLNVGSHGFLPWFFYVDTVCEEYKLKLSKSIAFLIELILRVRKGTKGNFGVRRGGEGIEVRSKSRLKSGERSRFK